MKYKLSAFFLSLFFITNSFAQVTITSSDSINCTNLCTTLTAHLVGDTPTNAGITEDDIYSPAIPIGFTFNFYGIAYTSLELGANGTIDFNAADAGAYDPWPITAALAGNPSKYNNICGPWCDIDIFYTDSTGSETYSTDGVAPYRKFSVTWCGCSMYSCGDAQLTTSQIIIYETTNVIEVHLANKDICTDWNPDSPPGAGGRGIIGVEAPESLGGIATVAPGRDWIPVWSATDEAWRFTPEDTGTGVFYVVASIPYAPIPYASSSLYWYNATTGAYLGTGDSINVCPTTATLYKCGALGCADTSFGYYFVSGSSPFIVTAGSINPSMCGASNGSIILSGMTPDSTDSVFYFYNGVPDTIIASVSSAGTITISGLSAGAYSNIIVRQAVCVSAPVDVSLTNPPIAITSVTTNNPSKCGASDGDMILNGLYPNTGFLVSYDYNGVAQPPAPYTSSATGAITIPNLSSGAYTNIVAMLTSAPDSCITPPAGPAYLENPPIAIGSVTAVNPTQCYLSDGYLTLNGLYGGTAFIVTYDNNGVTQPPVTLVTNASGSLTIPNLGQGTFSNIVAVLASSPDSCITPPVGPYTLTPPPPNPGNIVSAIHPSQCGFSDGSIVLYPFPSYTTDTINYMYNGAPVTPFVTFTGADSEIYLPGIPGGVYSGFTITIGICVYSVSGSAVLDSPIVKAGFDTSIHLGCHGDTVFFNNTSSQYFDGTAIPAGPLYYVWSFGDGYSDTSSNPYHVFLTQGTYTVTLLADDHDCWSMDTIPVTLFHPLFDSFTVSPNIVCQDSLIQFTNYSFGTPGMPVYYTWYFGDGLSDTNANSTHSYNLSGTYDVQLVAHDYVPCYDTFDVTVYSDTLSGLNITATDTVICEGTVITFTGLYAALGNTSITWSFGDGRDSINNLNPVSYAYDTTGNFTVVSTAYYRACRNVATTRNITVYQQPVLNLGPDTSICQGSGAITLIDSASAGIAGANWLWSTGQTTPAITVDVHGTYYATVSVHNCSSTDTIVVYNNCYMDIPNAFTPDGDGINDYFYPRQFLTKGLTSFKMDIYNRWGQLVFESTSLDGSGWDGKLNNVDQPQGVYIYVIDGTFIDGQKEHHQGNVTLLR